MTPPGRTSTWSSATRRTRTTSRSTGRTAGRRFTSGATRTASSTPSPSRSRATPTGCSSGGTRSSGTASNGAVGREGVMGLLRKWAAAFALVAASFAAAGAEPPPKPTPNNPDEPTAALSLARAAEFLDGATLNWLRDRNCASCHTGFPYLLARPALGDPDAPAPKQVRQFLEERV